MARESKIVTIVGARPQFIKAAAVSRALQASRHREVMVHTGQHYDKNMSDIFFEELKIPKPAYSLGVGSGPQGQQTGRMLEEIEKVLLAEKPAQVLVYGDTNSTLAGALAAKKLQLPLVHVEAGLRSFNMRMPEEVNRVLTDRISDQLFCPTETAVKNLRDEGRTREVWLTGDVMYDCALFHGKAAQATSRILLDLGIENQAFALVTLHRQENTDDPGRLERIFEALEQISKRLTVILPLHPRTVRALQSSSARSWPARLRIIEPVSFLDMVRLEQAAQLILTDSGGVQKEAFFHQVPCITLREETEWVETVESGWNVLAGAEPAKILSRFESCLKGPRPAVNPGFHPYGDGHAAEKIVSLLK